MHQLSMTLEHARERGRQAARAAAQRQGQQWMAEALACLTRFLARQDGPFLAEDVRQEYCGDDIEPRAWGHVMKHAQAQGLIRPVGYRAARSSNGSPKVLWSRA